MSIWAKIAKYGGSALKGAGSVAKQGLKSASNTAVHPTQALKGAGSAMKTAAVGSAAGYVAWQNLVNDKSMVEIASDVVVGKDTTEKISEAVEDVKGLKNKAGEAVDAVNGAMGDINSKWSGMSNFFRGIFGGKRTGDVRQLLQELRERQRVGTEPCRTGNSSVPHFRTFRMAWQDSRSHARHDAHRQQFQYQEHCQW